MSSATLATTLTIGAWPVVAALASGAAAAFGIALLHPPTRRLGPRVRPYTIGARVDLGRSADATAAPCTGATSPLARIVLPPLRAAIARVSGRLDSSGADGLRLRLRQSGLLADVPDDLRVQEFRVRQTGGAVVGALIGTVTAAALPLSVGFVLLLGTLGLTVGATRWPARLNRAIEDRRTRMRIELYTINQMLAMNVRVGGGAIQAVQSVVDRADGIVAGELAEVLRAHASGLRASEAFERAAVSTADPGVARTYRLLASGTELGADLAEALRALAADVREARREALRRQATRRRAAMLLPIIAILAPTMLLFIAAPIPSLIFGAR